MDKTDKFRYIKVILSSALMVGASVGLCFYASGVFYAPLSSGLGISLGEASMTTMFMLIFQALTTLLVPGLLRRFDWQHILLAGTALCAGAVILSSFCFNRFWIYLFASLMGCGAALIGPVPATTQINDWFAAKKYMATAVVLAGSALFAALLTPLMSAVITALGWRMGYVIEAILIVVLMVPALLWKMPLSPSTIGASAYGVHEEIPGAGKKQGMGILGAFALMAVLSACLIALPMHYPTLTTSMGQTAILGAQMLSWAMIGNLVFKLAGGWLSDHIKAVLASGILDLLALIGTAGILICLQTSSSGALRVMAFFFGSSYALSELSLPLFISNRFSRKRYMNVYALLSFLSTLTTAIAIPVVGFMYDALTSYVWIYVIAIVLEVIILLLIWYLIHDKSADELVTVPATSSMISNVRRWSEQQKEARKQKAARREFERRQKQDEEEIEKAQENVQFYENTIQAEPDASALKTENEPAEEQELQEDEKKDLNEENSAARSDESAPAKISPAESAAPVLEEKPESELETKKEEAVPMTGVTVTVQPSKPDDSSLSFNTKK